MRVHHGVPPGRTAYDMTGRDRVRQMADLRRQRVRVAAELAAICTDVHAGRRRMNQATLEAVHMSARRLAELDEALRDGQDTERRSRLDPASPGLGA